MQPYQFNEIYFRVTGEYENDIQILFFHSDASDMMVFDVGCFYLVNKPARICLEGFKCYPNKHKRTWQMLRIVENKDEETYIELEEALIKIAWYFSTADGQQVMGFSLFTINEHSSHYNQSLNNMKSARDVIPTDLRFVKPDLS